MQSGDNVSTDISSDRPKKRRIWLLVAMGATLVAVPAGLWLGRLAISEYALAQFCSKRGLECHAEVEKLSLTAVHATGIRIERDNLDPVTIERVEVELTWPKLFSPLVTSVKAVRPEAVVDTRGGEIGVDVFDAFLEQSREESSDGALPPFVIEDGRLTILTDAGPVEGVANTSGAINREVQTSFQLLPADLSLDGHALRLKGGEAHFVLASSKVTGELTLELVEADLQGFQAENIKIDAVLNPQSDDLYVAEWRVSSDQLQHAVIAAEALKGQGILNVRFNGAPSLTAAEITKSTAEINANELMLSGTVLKNAAVSLDLNAQGDGLKGPVSLNSGAFVSGDVFSSDTLLLAGDIVIDRRTLDAPSGSFEGAASLSGAAFGAALRESISGVIVLPQPVVEYGDAMSSSVDKLMSGFDTAVEARVDFDTANQSYSIFGLRPTAIRSPDRSIAVSVQPDRSETWLEIVNGELKFRGNIVYMDRDRGADVTARGVSLDVGLQGGNLSLNARQLALQPWVLGQQSLQLDMDGLRFARSGDEQTASAKGEARYSGPAFGAKMDGLVLIGAFAGLDTGPGWNIRLSDEDCFRYGLVSAAFDTTVFGPGQGRFCAPDGRLFSRESSRAGDVLNGRLVAEALDLPFSRPDIEGRLNFASPVLDWSTANGFSLSLQAEHYDFDFATMSKAGKGEPMQLSGQGAKASLKVGEGPIGVSVRLTDADFEMQSLPAGVSFADWTAEGILADAGPRLDWTVTGLQVFDNQNPENNALFQPIMSSGSGEIGPSGVTYEGRARLAKREGDFGTVRLRHDLSSGTGQVELLNGATYFRPNGLQLYDISERLRGLAVNTSGVIRPSLLLTWDGGNIDGSARVELDNISFSTFRLGKFRNLSGVLNISDLLELRTPPAQHFTLEALELTPTIVLRDGEIDIQVINPDLVHLEAAKWPFVDGQLSIDPACWAFDDTHQELTVRAEKWSLERLLGLFSAPDLDVRGTVSGKFPIEIIGPDIFFRDARLTAIEDGLISYTGKTGEQASSANEYAKMAFDALSNFEYKVLSLGANGNLLDEIVIDLALSGRNPELLDGQIFNLNITLQSKLVELIRGGSYATSTQATRDAVVELVRQKDAANGN